MDPHYQAIIAGYAAATAVVWLAWFAARDFVAAPAAVVYKRPWLEIGIVLLAAAATIGVGQLYVQRLLAPDEGVVFETLNQLLIFLPLLLVAFLRPPGTSGAGLPLGKPVAGLALGIGLAAGAVWLYATMRDLSGQAVFESVLAPAHVPHAAQVLFEDIAVAALLFRLRAALGAVWSVVLVAALFAAGHIPSMLANGASLAELSSLVLDTGIGVMVVGCVLATRSIWWLWPLHAALDMTQFVSGGG